MVKVSKVMVIILIMAKVIKDMVKAVKVMVQNGQ